MAKGLFIHDHKFPKINNSYFYSYGFDEEFFCRYKNMFSQLSIIGREVELEEINQSDKIEDNDINFTTISSYRNLLNKEIISEFDEQIRCADALIIRLPSILGLLSVYYANKNNKPYVIELVGCPWDAYWNMGFNRKIIAPIMKILTKKAVENSQYTIYVTERFLQHRYPTRGKSIACSNVTINDVVPESLAKRMDKIQSFDLSKKVVVGTIGTYDSIYKGQRYVIEAIANLRKQGYLIEYHLIGGGSNEYLKKKAEINGVSNAVYFHGKLKHDDVFNWLKSIDVYIQPSDTEGLPRSVIEAMSVACPIIGSNVGGIPELIDDSVIFEKGDVDRISELIKTLTVNKMQFNAQLNFEKSKVYMKQVLYKRREDFFNSFISDEIEVK